MFSTEDLSVLIQDTISSFLGGIAATIVFSSFASAVETEKRKKAYSWQQKKLVEDLFGGFANVCWSVGVAHLMFNHTAETFYRSSNVRAAVSLACGLHSSTESWLQKGKRTDFYPGLVYFGDNVVAVGSPVSDSASRDLLGYRGRPGHLRRGGFPIHLPVEFIMDSDQLLDKRPAKRFTGDNNIKRASPNWTLKVKDEVLPQPKLSRGGLLCNDYLVISRIPNFTSMRAFRERNEALIIAGTHGPGTEAIQLLINDLEKLRKIQQLRAHSSFFQALIPVTGIDHFEERTLRGKRLVSKPTSLGEPQVWPISVSHAQILKAMKNKRG